MKIIKIVIKGESGYGPGEEAYEDKLTIEIDKISYEYKPLFETEVNPVRTWSYKTSSPIYKMLYEQVAEMLPEFLGSEDDILVTDCGTTEFIVTYEDKTKSRYMFWCPPDVFGKLFAIIRQMVSGCEYTPALLVTAEDYEDE